MPEPEALAKGFAIKQAKYPCFLRNAFDQSPIRDGFIEGPQGVRAMEQRDFQLARAKFRNNAFRRQALFVTGAVKIVQKRRQGLNFF